MSNDNAFNGKLGVNMVLDSTPDTGPRVHAKENPRVSEMAKVLRDQARHDYAECPPEESDFWAAADALEAKDKLIAELVEALNSVADDIDLEAKYASSAGQMVSLEEIARHCRIKASKAKEQE